MVGVWATSSGPVFAELGSSRTQPAAERPAAPSTELSAAPATRDGQPRVALVRSRGDQVIAQRLAAELDALGFEVVEITGPEAVRPLARIAEGGKLDALLRATPSRTGIELVVAPPPDETGAERALLEDVVSVARGRRDDLLALRAVEALRARLLEAGLIAPPEVFQAPEVTLMETPELDEPSVPSEERSPPRPLLWIELAPTWGGDLDVGLGPRGQIALRLEPTEVWAVSVLGNFALRPHDLERSAGAAEVKAHFAGAAVDLRVLDASWVCDVGAGAAVVRLRAEGRAPAPFEGRSASATSALPFMRLALHPDLSSVLRLRFEVLGGFSVPRAIVGLGPEQVRWGAPYLQTSLVASLAVPALLR